jgi:hypothetical protein
MRRIEGFVTGSAVISRRPGAAHRRIEMESRRAYTAGGMVLLTDDGTRRRVPAGACSIDRQSGATGVRIVRWNELGTDYSAHLSRDDLRGYLLGCLVQYA